MAKLLIKCGVFLLLLVLVDKAFLPVRQSAPARQEDQRLHRLFSGELNKELIVIGSSRGAADIEAWALEAGLNLEAFNLSYGGTDVDMHTYLLEQLVAHNDAPRMIIKIIDDSFELTAADKNRFRFDVLYPLVRHAPVREELVRRGEKNYWLTQLFITHQLSKSAYDPRPVSPASDTIRRYGLMPKSGHIKDKEQYLSRREGPYEEERELAYKLAAFRAFQQLAHEHGIRVVYAIPPSFKPPTPGFRERITELLRSDELLFYNPAEVTQYQDRSLFSDPYHLNAYGAKCYTRDLLRFLQRADLSLPTTSIH
ncbi:MAG: hypothetical protein AAFZ52_03265 [Bacteroidota bacterium]